MFYLYAKTTAWGGRRVCAWSIEFEIPLGRGQRRAEDVTPLGLFGERELDT